MQVGPVPDLLGSVPKDKQPSNIITDGLAQFDQNFLNTLENPNLKQNNFDAKGFGNQNDFGGLNFNLNGAGANDVC